MKKALLAEIIALMATATTLTSCDSMESKTKKQLRNTMEELAKNPETLKISNEKVIFSNDSMCTISFIGRGQNGFGGFNSSRLEYTLVKVTNKETNKTQYNESIINMDDHKDRKSSIKETMEKVDGGYLYGSSKGAYDEIAKECKTKEEAKANYLYFQAMCNTITNGRIVDSND